MSTVVTLARVICRLFVPSFLFDLNLELNIVAVFGATFALVSLSARLMTVLEDDEEEKLQALLEQMETMQTTQATMQDELQNLQHQQGQP